jgi:hypothetical protein
MQHRTRDLLICRQAWLADALGAHSAKPGAPQSTVQGGWRQAPKLSMLIRALASTGK